MKAEIKRALTFLDAKDIDRVRKYGDREWNSVRRAIEREAREQREKTAVAKAFKESLTPEQKQLIAKIDTSDWSALRWRLATAK